MSARDATLFDLVGGERLRAIVEAFYRRVFDDVMIGYMFVGKDRARLIEKEWELAARMLGGEVRYTGRSMPEAHARTTITSGHFDRRTQLLRDTLAAHQVPAEVQAAWLGHVEALREQITGGAACNEDAADPDAPEPAVRAPSAPIRLGRR
ncbi:MAG TPA: group 1 truncated hemoglobin [Kofleriaceae bacterium]|nr:group 1 truncated hemoglobin [Kofleriaceae bacterium]